MSFLLASSSLSWNSHRAAVAQRGQFWLAGELARQDFSGRMAHFLKPADQLGGYRLR